jgi:DNA polymerase-3 subunit alpha
MSLLSEMRDKLTKSITVILDLHTLSSQLLDNLDTMLKIHGEKYPNKNCSLRFQVRDREESMLVDLPSKSFKVNPSDDLMAEIFNITSVQPVLA